MKSILILIVFILFNQALLITKMLDDKVEILLPPYFEPLSEDILIAKYPSNNRPTLVYSNENGTVNLAVNHTDNRISVEQLLEVKEVFVNQFKQIYPTAKWIRQEMHQINGRDFVVLELVTPALDTQIYNLMFATSLEGRMLMFSFNCTQELRGEWESIGNQIMESVKVR